MRKKRYRMTQERKEKGARSLLSKLVFLIIKRKISYAKQNEISIQDLDYESGVQGTLPYVKGINYVLIRKVIISYRQQCFSKTLMFSYLALICSQVYCLFKRQNTQEEGFQYPIQYNLTWYQSQNPKHKGNLNFFCLRGCSSQPPWQLQPTPRVVHGSRYLWLYFS